MKKSAIQIWLLAIRPKTLPAAIAPVLIGTAMAYGDGVHHFHSAFLCVIGALAIQIGTNLVNDYYDHKKGADTARRIGPVRVMQAGLVQPRTMQLAMTLTFVIAIVVCALLVKRGGTLIAVIGVLSVISGIAYTAGPYPLAYLGLGEFFVLTFFGPVAVAGTYYVQSLEMNVAVILAGFAPGLISSAILVVNNLRDIDGDRDAGRKTLAVRFGKDFSKSQYLFCIIFAALLPVLIYAITEDHIYTLAAVVTCLLAIPTVRVVFTKSDGSSLNNALASTGKLLLIYSVIFSIGWVL